MNMYSSSASSSSSNPPATLGQPDLGADQSVAEASGGEVGSSSLTYDGYCIASEWHDGGTEPVKDCLDPLEKQIICAARTADVYYSAPSCCSPGIALTFDSDHGGRVPLVPTLAVAQERERKHGAPDLTLRDRAAEAAAALAADDCTLFERVDVRAQIQKKAEHAKELQRQQQQPDQQRVEREIVKATAAFQRANLFFVMKNGDPHRLRIIIDGRRANHFIDASAHGFTIFSLEDIIKAVERMQAHNEWFAVEADLRHWFHQIGAPVHIRNMFLLYDRDGNCFRPRAFPMGFTLSPCVAQALTWGMLLQSERAPQRQNEKEQSSAKAKYQQRPFGASWKMDDNMAADLGIDVRYVKNLKALPRFLPLTCGGAIFVILDNILVITRHRWRAALWQQRIKDVTSDAKVTLKKDDNGEEVRLWALKLGDNLAFPFLGCEWRHSSRRVNVKLGEQIPGVKGDKWVGTHRDLASALGRLLWFHRVCQTPMYTADMQKFCELYSIVTPSEGGRWRDSCKVTDEYLRVLRDHWSLRDAMADATSSGAWVLSAPLPATGGCTAMCAVDASSGTRFAGTGLIGAVALLPAKSSSSSSSSSSEATNASGGSGGGSEHLVMMQKQSKYSESTDIALAELQAIVDAVVWLDKLHAEQGLKPISTFVIATDNLNAKGFVERQVAGRKEANSILCTFFEKHLRGRRIHLVYVKSEENAADVPSRRGAGVGGALLQRAAGASELEHGLAVASSLQNDDGFLTRWHHTLGYLTQLREECERSLATTETQRREREQEGERHE